MKIPTFLFLLLFCGVATGQSYLFPQEKPASVGTSAFYLLNSEQFSEISFSSLADTNPDNSESKIFGTAKNEARLQHSISARLQTARLEDHLLEIRKLLFPFHFFL